MCVICDVCVCVTCGVCVCDVCVGVRDESQVVRNAALFAIGQFAEYLQVTPLFVVSIIMPCSPSLRSVSTALA